VGEAGEVEGGTAGGTTGGTTVPDLVEAQVARHPGQVAVVEGERSLTYRELDERANRLAHHLVELGVGPEVPVGISVERSLDLAVGLLAILKAGGACLPLDPAYPAGRLAFMADNAGAPVLLTHERLAGRLPVDDAHVVALDAEADSLAAYPAEPPPRRSGPGHLAYLLYTSGSTGVPKGVELTHGALVHHHRSALALYRLGPGDRVLQFCSMSFDVSVEELFVTWASGATVVLRPDDAPLLGRPWADWLDRLGVTMLNLPTAYWHEWVADLRALGRPVPEALRLVVVGGDRALGAAYRTWLGLGGDRARWVNAYGPTEACVMATVFEPGADPGWAAAYGGDPPIGSPLPHATVHLLDPRGRPVADGEAGEIHIGGPALARGYRNRADLSAERFVPDPFSDQEGARLYRTGDLARRGPGGVLEFGGRLDDQVKVRGFRVELGAAAAVREDRPGDKRLVAYVVPAGTPPTARDLRRFLGQRLPSYLVPTAFVAVDALPLGPNGTLDRRALPPPATTAPLVDRAGRDGRAGPTADPTSPVEQGVAAVWAEVLGVDQVGADDDFFDLGGHSLLATQAVARLREAFGVDIPLPAIFEAPTVAGLAAVVEAAARAGSGANLREEVPLGPQPRVPGERLPLSLPQEQMWRLEVQASPRGLYNVTAQHRFPGPADAATLRAALAHLAERHEILRTSFPSEEGRPWQAIAPSVPVAVEVVDLARVPRARREKELRRRVAEEDARPFDLDVPPLFRATLFRLGDDGDEVAVTFDHLVSDGTSAYVFLSELAAAYQAFADGRSPALRPLPVHYADFAVWQRRWLTDERLDAQLAYWLDTLAGMPLGPAIPFDHVPTTLNRRIDCRPFAVAPDTYRALQGVVRECRASMFVACVAALSAVAGRMGGTPDVVLSTTLSGRNRPELEGVLGFFAGVGRIRTDLAGDPTLGEVLDRARDRVLGLFDHQDVPFLRVRDALLPDFPSQVTAVELMAVLPIEVQYFHAAHDEWAPGVAVIERPGPDRGPDRLFFRGQLPPLSVTFLDDGAQLWAECNHKVDFYEAATVERLARGLELALARLATEPHQRLSALIPDLAERDYQTRQAARLNQHL
jgi:amino acid adenylation domain-containing protein